MGDAVKVNYAGREGTLLAVRKAKENHVTRNQASAYSHCDDSE